MSTHTIYGINAVAAILQRQPERVEKVFLLEGLGTKRRRRLDDLIKRQKPCIDFVDAAALRRLTGTDKHQGAAALIADRGSLQEVEALRLVESIDQPLILVLDGVQDPRNFGACLRTADAAGTDLVVTARNRNAPLTPVVSKVSSGAAESQSLAEVGNLARFLTDLSAAGVWLIGTDQAATDSLYAVDLTEPVAIVMGGEGTGLRRLTRERCDRLVRVPMHGAVESLNVSVAAGICLYECRRQRAAVG